MVHLYERVRSLTGSDNDQVKETLTQYFQKLARSNDSDHTQWLDTLEVILTRFPKSCLQHRNSIETYLVQFLDCEHECWVIAAAKCCHVLQQVRPANDKSANAKSCWRQQMALLCSAAHEIMGAAFSDAVDIYRATRYFQKPVGENASSTETVMGVALSQLSSASARLVPGKEYVALAPTEKSSLLCKRLRNVFTFIQAMLVERYPAAKPVRPQAVLDAAVRTLSVTGGAARDADGARVKAQALRTLDALVVCLGSNLLPYSPLLFRLISQTLRWSAEHETKDSLSVRRGCYDSLTLWLSTLQCHRLEGEASRGRGTSLEEELLTRLLDDVAPRTYLIQLTMSNQSTKNLSKKARRKMANTILGQSGIAHHIPGEKKKEAVVEEDPEVVLAALRCLELLLTTSGLFLKPATHKKVQECLVRQCYALTAECAGARALALCRALEACRLAAPPTVAPPTHHCLAVYSRLHTGVHAEVAQFCSSALLSLRAELHAAPPTLSFEPSPQRPRAASAERDAPAAVSGKNRAVLAALLGEDRLPPQKPEDVITIPDNSINRKRRADESDQISVSSQSSNVVEIDESNGVDLDSPGTDFDDPIEVDEIDYVPEPSISNGKMKLLDFDDREKKIDRTGVIHELPTQMPHDNVLIADDNSDSIEVSYDHSGKADEKIKFLDKLEGDNLPSTGETDDVQITCGQQSRNSQESQAEKPNSGVAADSSSLVRITNEMDVERSATIECPERSEVNGQDEKLVVIEIPDDVKDSNKEGVVNVDAMLADFVDEKAEGNVD